MNALPTLRSLPSFAYLVLIGLVLTGTAGLYHPTGLLLLLLGLAIFFLALLPRFQKGSPVLSPRTSTLLFLLGTFGFCALMAWQPNIFYPQSQLLYSYFQAVLQLIALLLGAQLLVLFRLPLSETACFRWFLVLLSAFFYARFFVLSLSPAPYIDVFTTCSLAADYLLGGFNPYSQEYPDIYNGAYNQAASAQYGAAYNYVTCMQYGPIYLYLATPFRLLHDIRLASIASDALTMGALWRIGVFLQWNTLTRSALLILWLAFPVSLYVLEQSWIDPLLVAALAWSFCFLLENKWTALGVVLGIACGIKHYGAVAAFLVLLHLAKKGGFKSAAKTAGIAAAVFIAAQLPFLLVDAHALIQSTWTNFLTTPPRQDALTLWAWVWNSFNIPPLKGQTLVLSAILICLILWRLWRSAPSLNNLTSALILTFSVLFLFGYQAFCNYYYLLAFFVFLDLVFSLSPASAKKDPGSPDHAAA